MESALPSAAQSKYRADIDGLRAIAVLAVLLYHYGAPGVTGGFVGVDIFFVISGYLITRLLVGEIAGTGLSLVDFYSRRIRRILPALCLILLVSLVAGWWFLMPGDYADLGKSAAYAAAGLGNLYFYEHTGYFDRAAELRPLLHLWSLGVEEQFYLVWPALLALVIWTTGGRRRIIAGIILGLTVLDFLYAAHEVAGDPKAAFYLPQGRAWELGLGALLVFLPALPPRLLAEAAGLAGLGLIAYAVLALTPQDAFPGINALWPCLGAALLVWPRRGPSFLGRALATFPLRWTGNISYSLYLWHWPLLVFLRIYENGREPPAAALAALGIAAYLLACLSWRWVERPFRRWHARPAKVAALGLAAIPLLVVLGSAVSLQAGFPSRLPAWAASLGSLDEMWAWSCNHSAPFADLEGTDCVFGQPWDGAEHHGLVWGDSHAEHMAPLIEVAARGLQYSFLLYLPCPAAFGGKLRRDPDPQLPQYAELCTKVRARGIKLLRDHPDIDLVIFPAAWSNLVWVITPPAKKPGGPDSVALLKEGLEDLLQTTAAPGRRFLIIGTVPQYFQDPVACAVANLPGLVRRRCRETGLPVSGYDRLQRPTDEALLAIAATRTDTTVVLPGPRLCVDGICQSYIDGELIYRDRSHLRRNLSEGAKRRLADLFGLTGTLRALQ